MRPAPLPLASKDPIPAYEPSPALSLLSRPGETGIRTRRVAILVANGVDGKNVREIYSSLLKDGAVPRLVGNMLGKVKTSAGDPLDVEISLEAGPSVMYDAVIVPDGDKSADLLGRNAQAMDFLREQYRHCKPILALGGGADLLTKAMIPATLPDGADDPALLIDGSLDAFKEALASLGLLKTDAPFRRFVITRALLMASSLASPFLVLVAQEQASLPLLLGSFVLASSLASTVSATVWGYMADTSSRNVMVRGGGLAAVVCLLAGGLAAWGPQADWLHWLYPLAFFVLAIAHAGVRIGRKTYMVDMAGGTKRTDYTAVSNTVIGVLLLAVGGISAGVALLGNDWALLVLGGMGAVGVFSALSLKEV